MKRLLFILTPFVFFIFGVKSQGTIVSWPLQGSLSGVGAPGITVHDVTLGAGIANDGWVDAPTKWCHTVSGCSGLKTRNWTSTTTSLTKTASGGTFLGNRYVEFSFTLNAGQPSIQLNSFKFDGGAGFNANCTGTAYFAVYWSKNSATAADFTGISRSGYCVYEASGFGFNHSNDGSCRSFDINGGGTCWNPFPMTVNAGDRVRFRVYIGTTHSNSTNGGWRAIFGNASIEKVSPLAVTLNSFNANCENNGTEVNWSTASEQNASHFDLERSGDGETWNNVTTVLANGNSNSLKTYSVKDNARLTDDYYYRLRQVDFDGKEEIYGPVTVNCGSTPNNSLLVFPNPSSGEFAVEVNSNEVLEGAAVVVYDISGKQLLKQDLNSKLKGINMVYFTDNNLAPGTYLVVVESETKNNFTPVKLVIR